MVEAAAEAVPVLAKSLSHAMLSGSVTNLNSELFSSTTKMMVFSKESLGVMPAKTGIHRFFMDFG